MSLRLTRSAPLTFASLAFAALALPARAQEAATHHAITGSRVAVYDLAGTVRVVAGGTGAVGVDVVRGGRDAGRLTVQTGEIAGRQTLRVVFPEDRIVYPALGHGDSESDLRVRDDGTFGGNESRGGRGHRVTVRSRGDGLEAWADVTITVPKGQAIDVMIGVGKVSATNVDGRLSIDAASADVSATGSRGYLSLDTGSGDVTVSDAEGELEFDTGSGDVKVDRLRGTRLSVDAGSGEIRGAGLTFDDLHLDLGSGGARLGDVHARDLDIDSGSGDVDLALAGDIEHFKLDSGSGDVTLRLAPTLGASLIVDTGSGGVETAIPIAVRKRDESVLVGTIGDGRGRMEIESGSGRVRIVALR